MPSSSISKIRARVGLALIWFTAACSGPVAQEILAPQSSCPGTHGAWTAEHGAITVTMTLQQDGREGWLGMEWITWGTGRVARRDDGLPLAEFLIGTQFGRSCLLPFDLNTTWPQSEGSSPARPLLAHINAEIAWERGHRVIRGTVNLNGTAWTHGPHPLGGVDTLVFRLR